MNFLKRPNRAGDKKFFYCDFTREKGRRPSTGIFIYANPKDQIQKNHGKETFLLLEIKTSQLSLEKNALGAGVLPSHKVKLNFLYY